VKFKHTNSHIKKVPTFKENPGVNLIHWYHMKAKKHRKEIEVGKTPNEFCYLRKYTLKHKGVIADRTITEQIRIIDVSTSECSCMRDQLGSRVELVDVHVRRCYPSRISAAKIKIISGFNYYGKRSRQINKGMDSQECLRCLEIKD